MSPLSLVLLGALVAIALAIVLRRAPSLGRAVEDASARQEVAPVVEAVERLRPSARTAALNHAIRRLWDRYERPLAVDLVKVLAERHGEALIAQYWLGHVAEVEPELARDRLGREFLDRHYRPELAAQCGKAG